MKQHRNLLLPLLLLIGLPQIAAAQTYPVLQPGDTVHARWRTSVLGDGTRFLYELGCPRIKHAGAKRYLTYADTTGRRPYHFLRTVNFTANGSSDSIGFTRFVGLDDASTLTHNVYFSADTLALDSMLRAVINHYDNRVFTPTNAAFDTNSSILYLVELRDAATDTVIRIVDSTVCYRNGAGRLRYMNLDASANDLLDGIPLTGTATGQSVYLEVRTVLNLPAGSGFASHEYDEVGHNGSGGAGAFRFVGQLQDLRSLKSSAPIYHRLNNTLGQLSFEEVYPNPSNGDFHLRFRSLAEASCRISLVEMATGKTRFVQDIILTSGENSVPIHVSEQVSGEFFLLFSDGLNTSTQKITFSR